MAARQRILEIFEEMRPDYVKESDNDVLDLGHILMTKQKNPPKVSRMILEGIVDDIPETWEEFFIDIAAIEIKRVFGILSTMDAYLPRDEFIFRAFHATPLPSLKIVIMGQDPYPKKGDAMGMSFSTWRDNKIPASLSNIYKELKEEYKDEFKIPYHGDLTEWANQGVLLLNKCLTVTENAPKSHGELWTPFINKVVRHILKHNPRVIFVLWGRQAQSMESILGSATVLKAGHPSSRNLKGSFLGCGHFKQINEILIKEGKEPINWQISRN